MVNGKVDGGRQSDAGFVPSENVKLKKANSIEELLSTCPKNQTIGDNLIRAWSKINSPKYKKIMCSISGGSDSDVMLDIVWRCDKDNKVDYVWFDTGLEYQATKDHLLFLENKYGIKIKRHKPKKPIPICCKEYGQPFVSKIVSKYIYNLQRHGFKFEDKSYEQLRLEYVGIDSYLKWWCNINTFRSFNVSYFKYLKEFLILHPPTFKISSKCCEFAKKKISHSLIKNENYDLNIYGVRKAEGGIRASAYQSCFDESDGCDHYRPLFWYTNQDKKEYEIAYHITHSKCYTEYGFVRTGCACCPYGKEFEEELVAIEQCEPKLYKAVNYIFGDSYEYTRKYREFRKKMEENNTKK